MIINDITMDCDEEKKSLLSNDSAMERDTIYFDDTEEVNSLLSNNNVPTSKLTMENKKEPSLPRSLEESVESGLETDDEFEEEEEHLTTVFETFWNISNAIQGLPILAIPYAIQSGGWVAMATLIVISVASLYTSQILVKSLYETKGDVKIRVRSSYMDIGEAFWGCGGRNLVLVIMVLELVLVSTMYPVLVGSLLSHSFPMTRMPLWAWTLIGGIALIPNALLKNLSQVAWTSIITVACSIVIFITVLIYCFIKYSSWQFRNLNHFSMQEFPAAVTIIIACYLAQPFAPYLESTMKTPTKYMSAMNWSFFSMTALNIFIGFFAAVTFFPNIEEVITDNLPAGPFRIIINATSAILALTSYTLPMFTSFDVIEKSDLLCAGNRRYLHVTRVFLILSTIVMAAFIHNFVYLLAFVGTFTGITLEFIFPPLFHLKIYFFELRLWERMLDLTILFLGTLCLIICLIVSWISMYTCFKHGKCFEECNSIHCAQTTNMMNVTF